MTDKYLVVVGLSDEEEAHLRLLMRRAAIDHLSHMWRWGDEDQADLFIVDPTNDSGQLARDRASGAGKRCAVFGAKELREGEHLLPRPMKLESVADLLNEVGAAAEFEVAGAIIPSAHGFYDMSELDAAEQEQEGDAGEEKQKEDEIEEVELNLESGEQREATPAQGLDDLLRPDSVAARPSFAVSLELKEDSMIEAGRVVTARREKRVADATGGGTRRGEFPADDINLAKAAGVRHSAPMAPTSLRDYLRGNLLGGPATISLKGAPALTLDPKARMFHSSTNSLQALAPYCAQTLPHRDWRPLTTTDLARVREQSPAQPYSRLIWLATLVQSGGRLATHLDPGGRYRLKPGTTVESELPAHARIGKVMHDMAKLNEIAAVSGAPMAEVFDVVNAYDAINALETERRQPRHSEPPRETARGGLFSKLRKSLIGR